MKYHRHNAYVLWLCDHRYALASLAGCSARRLHWITIHGTWCLQWACGTSLSNTSTRPKLASRICRQPNRPAISVIALRWYDQPMDNDLRLHLLSVLWTKDQLSMQQKCQTEVHHKRAAPLWVHIAAFWSKAPTSSAPILSVLIMKEAWLPTGRVAAKIWTNYVSDEEARYWHRSSNCFFINRLKKERKRNISSMLNLCRPEMCVVNREKQWEGSRAL